MKLKSYNILFRIFSFLSDKTNGAPFFVKYKLLLGTLILGLVASVSAKAQKKEMVSDTISLRSAVPSEITCYKPAHQEHFINKLDSDSAKNVIQTITNTNAKVQTNIDSLIIKSIDTNTSHALTGIMCYGIAIDHRDNDDIYRRSTSKKEREFKYNQYDIRPISPNGDLEGFQEWVQSNIRYTEQIRKDKVHGEVILSFAIDKKGNLVDKKVIRKLSKEADKEALRVLSSSEKWEPGELYGNPVKTTMTIKINFNCD
ncbi:MAG: energy transducer TonB [Dysgonomonas sp.]